MRKYIIFLFLLATHNLYAQELLTTFEKSEFMETSTYEEGMAFYTQLATASDLVMILEEGPTDAGIPLHLVLISGDQDFDIASNRAKGKSILMINNAIHPGEPDGVEASQMLARDLVNDESLHGLLDNTLVAIIPFYNIGGALNRNSGSRTNQNGPKMKGFRGNSLNFDLNRDFIKNDTKNARSFSQIFQTLDPDMLIDTHVSNGADYQYVLTMVTPQADKLGEPLKGYLNNKLMPSLYTQMKASSYEMTPYVNVWGSTPDKGWSQFFDSPRYSSGYAALFQTIGFQSETHMLKTFEQRTWATYNFLLEALKYINLHGSELIKVRRQAIDAIKVQKEFPIAWELDNSDSTMISFKGFTATYPISEISGLERLKYDREQPYTMDVAYYNHFEPSVVVTKPDYYVIPQSWSRVIDAFAANNVLTQILNADTVVKVKAYTITDYSSRQRPWEGHFFHDKVSVELQDKWVGLRKGDVLVPVNQRANRYIVETLEPEASDSFFRWNYFDTMLETKEGFSPYVFEDEAIEILNNDENLKKEFEAKKASEADFSQNGYAQLQFIFMHSEHREQSYMLYPIYRLMK